MDVVVRQNHASELMAYLYKMYQESCLTDMQMMGYDGKVYNVHRVVLNASSQYLQKLGGDGATNPSISLGIVIS